MESKKEIPEVGKVYKKYDKRTLLSRKNLSRRNEEPHTDPHWVVDMESMA